MFLLCGANGRLPAEEQVRVPTGMDYVALCGLPQHPFGAHQAVFLLSRMRSSFAMWVVLPPLPSTSPVMQALLGDLPAEQRQMSLQKYHQH